MSAVSLPRYYGEEPTREREVALYIDGGYVCRGPVSEGLRAARGGWVGWSETVSPGRLTWERDQNPKGGDRPCLGWASGERLSSKEFLAWAANA